MLINHNSRCGVEVRLWRLLKKHRDQYPTIQHEYESRNPNLNYIEDINCNHEQYLHHNNQHHNQQQSSSNTTQQTPQPPPALSSINTVRELQRKLNSNTLSNCNSFDSSSTNNTTESSEDVTEGSDYESCNGLDHEDPVDL